MLFACGTDHGAYRLSRECRPVWELDKYVQGCTFWEGASSNMDSQAHTGGAAVNAASTVPEATIFGHSTVMQQLRLVAKKIAATNLPLVIQGAGGTGKEVLARWIHSQSQRRGGPFVKVNCAAIPSTLLESELFGHEKGAFTGAYQRKLGRVELARGGTLFLDEIGNLDLNLQVKLVHFLQDGRFSRIGDHEEQWIETRIICATGRDLEEEVKTGTFRADLYYRINVVHVKMPRLQERFEDIPMLADYFLKSFNARYKRNAPCLSTEAITSLQMNDWPGNIRQFENYINRYVIIGELEAADPLTSRQRLVAHPIQLKADGSTSLKRITKMAIREVERKLILKALQENRWNRRKTAHALNISYRALLYKIGEAGLAEKQTQQDNST